jgi:DNA-binding transcriptional ArsR family regulator
MVNLSEPQPQPQPQLSRTFAALADPTRRALISQLRAADTLSVSALAEPFAISLPAVMKHLDHLADAGLVSRSKTGRVVSYTLTPTPLEAAMTWLEHHREFWTGSLDRLEARVQQRMTAVRPPRSPKRKNER